MIYPIVNVDCWSLGEVYGRDLYISCWFENDVMDDGDDDEDLNIDDWDSNNMNDEMDKDMEDSSEWRENAMKNKEKDWDSRTYGFSTATDEDMETWLWVTYLSGLGWWFGWILMLPLGTGIYSWLGIKAMIDFFTVIGAEEGIDLW